MARECLGKNLMQINIAFKNSIQDPSCRSGFQQRLHKLCEHKVPPEQNRKVWPKNTQKLSFIDTCWPKLNDPKYMQNSANLHSHHFWCDRCTILVWQVHKSNYFYLCTKSMLIVHSRVWAQRKWTRSDTRNLLSEVQHSRRRSL